jgi:hypothetical protein
VSKVDVVVRAWGLLKGLARVSSQESSAAASKRRGVFDMPMGVDLSIEQVAAEGKWASKCSGIIDEGFKLMHVFNASDAQFRIAVDDAHASVAQEAERSGRSIHVIRSKKLR